ncbi:MAG: helix-turn-helix transcriptional regulator [Lachnospiraceae bacterium]|nr:helix-turn-helix transcriptional regulator [Lachnospiraceae bacterium]
MMERQEKVYLILLFMVYMFVYMVSGAFIQAREPGVISAVWIERNYYLRLFFGVVGYYISGEYKSIISHRGAWHRKVFVGISFICCISVIMLAVISSPLLFLFWANLLAVCVGVCGGEVYACMSARLYLTDYMGKVMGFGASAAIILQCLLQRVMGGSIAGALVLAIDFGILAALFMRGDNASDAKRTLEMQESEQISEKTLCRIVGITMFFSCFFMYYNENLLRLIIVKNSILYEIYGWPRIFSIMGYLVVGFVGDIKKRKYVPFAVLCMAIPALITSLLPVTEENYLLIMCIFYICLGALASYVNLVYWSIAPRTKNMTLWAGMGRILMGVTELFWGIMGLSRLSNVTIVVIELFMIIFMIIFMALNGDLSFAEICDIPSEELPVRAVDRMEEYRSVYKLTQKESEVLGYLIFREDTLQEIADSMHISRRVLQRYITSIYEKTGTRTRSGLVLHYMTYDTGTSE